MKRTVLENGQKFGRWTVIDSNYVIRNTHRYVMCRCECGIEQLVASADLVAGRTKSCKHCVALNRRKLIPIGTKSKNWTVTGKTKMSNSQNLLYEVACKCGNTRYIIASEFYNPYKTFECMQCAAKSRGCKAKIKNGLVGDLDADKYGRLKRMAETRNILFNVSQEYLWNLYESQNRKCAITGDHLPSILEASLDRINSEGSYEEGNVQWVTSQANLSKHIMSMNELYEFCKKVLNHANQQPSISLTTDEGSETNSII